MKTQAGTPQLRAVNLEDAIARVQEFFYNLNDQRGGHTDIVRAVCNPGGSFSICVDWEPGTRLFVVLRYEVECDANGQVIGIQLKEVKP